MTVPVLYIRLDDQAAAELLGRLDELVAEKKKEYRRKGLDTRGIGASTVALELLAEKLGIELLNLHSPPSEAISKDGRAGAVSRMVRPAEGVGKWLMLYQTAFSWHEPSRDY